MQTFSVSQALKPTPAKITIDSGVLVGETLDGVNVFRGVPYAKPPMLIRTSAVLLGNSSTLVR